MLDIIKRVKSKGHMWKGKFNGQSNHLETLVWVLFIREMPGEHRQKTYLKANHLKSMAKRDKLLSLQEISSASHDYHSMMIVIQNMGDITMFLAINVLFQSEILVN